MAIFEYKFSNQDLVLDLRQNTDFMVLEVHLKKIERGHAERQSERLTVSLSINQSINLSIYISIDQWINQSSIT